MKQGQFPAVLTLRSLNGQNGFKLDGEISVILAAYQSAPQGISMAMAMPTY